jgi:hypothetical protein
MATSTSFLPNKDAALLAWSLNFSAKITATPTAYGLTAPQATAYATLHTNYATALAACDPGERSKSLVAAKNAARAALKSSARLLALLVQGTASVTDAQKLELGLTVRAMPSPIPPPAYAPALDVVSVSGRTVRIRLHDSTDAARRGKPAGVNGATVLSFVGTTPPDGVDGGWKFEGNTGRTIVDVVFPETVAAGAKVWLAAFWFNGSKQSGPICAPVGTNVQFGVSMAA